MCKPRDYIQEPLLAEFDEKVKADSRFNKQIFLTAMPIQGCTYEVSGQFHDAMWSTALSEKGKKLYDKIHGKREG